MVKDERTRKLILYAYLGVEAFLFVLYIFVIRGYPTGNFLQWLSILLCFVFALLMGRNEIELSALFFTALADIFLVAIQPPYLNTGMVFFMLVQFAHAFYFYTIEPNKKKRLIILLCRLILTIIMIIASIIVVKDQVNFVVIAAMIYFSNLVISLICAFMIRNPFLMFGYMCFIMCDLDIGFSFIPVIAQSAFYDAINTFNLVWVFYLPSQLLITLNSTKSLGYLDRIVNRLKSK